MINSGRPFCSFLMNRLFSFKDFYFLIFILSAGLCAYAKTEATAQGRKPPAIHVQTVTLEPEILARTISAVGSLASPQTTEVTADRGGKIIFLDIPEGKEVEQGHVLAQIDADEASAAVAIARAQHELARVTLGRLKKMPKKARAEQSLDNAGASVETTRGSLDEALTIFRKMTIQAPFSGRLSLRKVSIGTYMDPGDTIVRITQIRPLHLIFTLPQHHVSEIAEGQQIDGVAGHCGARFAATVTAIDPYLDPETRSVTVQAIVPNEDRSLLPGMAAALHLSTGGFSDTLAVPSEAIIRRGTERIVYTVHENIVKRRSVTLGHLALRKVEILAGLTPGDVVVVSGHQKLRPGVPVQTSQYQPVQNDNLSLGTNKTLLATCDF